MQDLQNFPVTIALILVTCIVSWRCFEDRRLFETLKHFPYAEKRQKQWYRLVSSGFVHGSYIHLIINMFVLYTFGRFVELAYTDLFGRIPGIVLYLILYILTIIAGDIPTYLKHQNNPRFGSIGASGAVSGIVFIYVLFKPWDLLYIYGIIPIYAIIGALLYLGYSSWASRRGQGMIDHDAHLYGALFGMLFTIICQPRIFSLFIAQLFTPLTSG